ncbi:MAG TPA: hypothetical protein VK995_05395, partial [Oceanipulchritudo sp.]|nr:hypothetical protein [Oceanipulchritudo sp.]
PSPDFLPVLAAGCLRRHYRHPAKGEIRMKKTAFLQALVLAILLVASWLLLLNRFKADQEPVSSQPIPVESLPANPKPADPQARPAPDQAAPVEPPEGWREWTDYLAGRSTARDMRWALEELRRALFSQPPAESVERIMELLDNGFDLRTRLLFQVGPSGHLTGAGSLRAQLLDWLGQLDPVTAATYARQQLETMGTRLDPEEYVVHMRNFSWGTPEDAPGRDAFLGRHFQGLLDNRPWLENPGPAIAEAMDIAVYLTQPVWVPAMARLDLPGQPEVLQHASSIALERLIDQHPLPAVEALLNSSEGRELDSRKRASLVARLDPADPASQDLLTKYLSAPGISPSEAAAYLEYFPNLNLSLSHTLLSRRIPITEMPPHMDRLQRALAQVEEWLQDPGLNHLAGELQTTRTRLYQQMTGEPAP